MKISIPTELDNPLIAWTLSGMMSTMHGRTYRASAIIHDVKDNNATIYKCRFGTAQESHLTPQAALSALADMISKHSEVK